MARRARRGLVGAASAALTTVLVTGVLGYVALTHPQSPLPDHWNPARPLDPAAPVTPLTHLKLSVSDSGEACLGALARADAGFTPLPDLDVSDQCGITDRVRLTRLGMAQVAPLETTCAIALRLAMWERHSLRPALGDLGEVAEIRHASSYNCRPIRTPSGPSGRMSLHATAEAVDITGVRLRDGRTLTLLEGWTDPRFAVFWRALRDGGCTWFATALGPDYNSLHADHFHFQSRGWGLCR
jgi:hypothetical protein